MGNLKDAKIMDTNAMLFYHQAIKALLADKVAKETGKSLLSDTEIERLKKVVNYDDSTITSDIADLKVKIEVLEKTGYDDTQLRKDINDKYLSKTAISDWAKSESKPVYTATEVGADASGSANTALENSKAYTNAVVKEIKDTLTGGVHYKGSVDNWTDLPTKNDVGDCWNIKNASDYNKAGDNAIWTGIEWDVTAGNVDLSLYYNTNDIATNEDIQIILNS